MKQQILQTEIDATLLERLDALCRSWGRDRTEIVNEALAQYLDWNDAQMAHIRAGIEEADRGDFVPHSEVVAMFEKWRDRCG